CSPNGWPRRANVKVGRATPTPGLRMPERVSEGVKDAVPRRVMPPVRKDGWMPTPEIRGWMPAPEIRGWMPTPEIRGAGAQPAGRAPPKPPPRCCWAAADPGCNNKTLATNAPTPAVLLSMTVPPLEPTLPLLILRAGASGTAPPSRNGREFACNRRAIVVY